MSTHEIKRAVMDEWRRLRDEYCEHLLPVSIRWSKRMTRTLGSCRYRRGPDGTFRPFEVVMSHSILACGIEQALDTLRHEAAHAIAGRDAKHGPAWKAWARELGATPRACGKLTAEQRQARAAMQPQAKWTIRCTRCGAEDTRRSMKRDVRFGFEDGQYRHGGGNGCGGTLEVIQNR